MSGHTVGWLELMRQGWMKPKSQLVPGVDIVNIDRSILRHQTQRAGSLIQTAEILSHVARATHVELATKRPPGRRDAEVLLRQPKQQGRNTPAPAARRCESFRARNGQESWSAICFPPQKPRI